MIFQFFEEDPLDRLPFNTTIELEDATDGSIAFSVTMIERREVAFSPRCV